LFFGCIVFPLGIFNENQGISKKNLRQVQNGKARQAFEGYLFQSQT